MLTQGARELSMTYFMQFGKIINGTLNGAPILRKARYDISNSTDYKANIHGTKLNAGISLDIRYYYLIGSMSGIYSKTYYTISPVPKIYNSLEKRSTTTEFFLEVSIGTAVFF